MKSRLLRLIAEYVEKKTRGRYYEVVTDENNKLLAPFRVFGDDPENIEDTSGDNAAIQTRTNDRKGVSSCTNRGIFGISLDDDTRELLQKWAIQAEAGAGGDPADKLKGLPNEDREIFEKMLIYASELEKAKPKDRETDHFKKPEGNFSQEVKRSKFKKIEIDDCELGKVSYNRYWIRKISTSNRYWEFKKH